MLFIKWVRGFFWFCLLGIYIWCRRLDLVLGGIKGMSFVDLHMCMAVLFGPLKWVSAGICRSFAVHFSILILMCLQWMKFLSISWLKGDFCWLIRLLNIVWGQVSNFNSFFLLCLAQHWMILLFFCHWLPHPSCLFVWFVLKPFLLCVVLSIPQCRSWWWVVFDSVCASALGSLHLFWPCLGSSSKMASVVAVSGRFFWWGHAGSLSFTIWVAAWSMAMFCGIRCLDFGIGQGVLLFLILFYFKFVT